MKRALIITFFAGLLAVAGVHPPNDNKICSRPGCGHPKYSHAGNGPCNYSGPGVDPGHCPRFVK